MCSKGSESCKLILAEVRNSADGQRPTAKDLLKHKFIRSAKKATYLTELIEKYERYRELHPKEEDKPKGDTTVG